MNKTILLGANNEFTLKANQWLFRLTAILFFLNAGFHLYYGIEDTIRFAIGILMLVGALFYFFYASVGFSVNSRFSPKVKVDEKGILLKKNPLKSATTISWSEISSISFKNFEIVFIVHGEPVSFSYKTNPDVSIQIKQAVREFAEMKGVEVIGG